MYIKLSFIIRNSTFKSSVIISSKHKYNIHKTIITHVNQNIATFIYKIYFILSLVFVVFYTYYMFYIL